MRPLHVLFVLIAIPLGMWGLYKFNFPTYSWNQKLTVEVMTPSGPVTGSSVINVTWKTQPRLRIFGGALGRFFGEATVVDLGDGRYLFAVLRGADPNPSVSPSTIIFNELAKTNKGSTYEQMASDVYWRRGAAAEPFELAPENYPLLVTFHDLGDPASVKEVKSDALTASFGSGFSLDRISIEVTDEDVTNGTVEKLLPWLKTLRKKRATLVPDPPRLLKDANVIQRLKPRAFSTELNK